jgi:hypothetical protein
MALDLETLRAEMQAYLESSGMAAFYGYHHVLDTLTQVSWDTDGHPDFREFVEAARKANVSLIVFNHQAFSLDQIDSALDELEQSELTREEKRNYETRLRQLRDYEGFTCSLELSFALEGRVYVYERHTEWYATLTEILAELDAASEEEEEGDSDGTIGGYFSNN